MVSGKRGWQVKVCTPSRIFQNTCKNMTKILKRGDIIGIAASSSPFDKKQFQRGIKSLKKMGFKVFYHSHIFSKENYLAGNDQRRAKELLALFKNKKVKAILFARGGYGAQRIIPLLNLKILKKNRKPVVGVSDITALLTFLRQKAGIPTFYGPVVTQLGNDVSLTNLSLKRALTEPQKNKFISLKNCKIMQSGRARGKLVGGCLSLITSSIGTPYDLNTKNAILFFEDVDEKVYAIDRMLTQLKNSGKLNGVNGILIGSLFPVKGEKHSMEVMLKNTLKDFKGPIVTHFPAGHTKKFVTLPLGIKITLDTSLLGDNLKK